MRLKFLEVIGEKAVVLGHSVYERIALPKGEVCEFDWLMAFDAKRFFADPPVWFSGDRLNIILGFFLGTLLTGVFNNYSQYAAQATVFFILLIVWGFGSITEFTSKAGDRFMEVIGIGKNFWLAAGVGVVFGGLMVFSNQSIATLPQSIVAVKDSFSFLFIVVVAPFAEANFFRGLLMPEINLVLRDYIKLNHLVSGVGAVVLSALVFAWYHWYVLSGAFSALTATFLFGCIMGLGVYYFKSVGFEYGAHGVNNLLVVLK